MWGIMNTYIWVAVIAALSLFLLWKTYKLGFKLGYKTGATVVLNEWKQYIREGDEIDEDFL